MSGAWVQRTRSRFGSGRFLTELKLPWLADARARGLAGADEAEVDTVVTEQRGPDVSAGKKRRKRGASAPEVIRTWVSTVQDKGRSHWAMQRLVIGRGSNRR